MGTPADGEALARRYNVPLEYIDEFVDDIHTYEQATAKCAACPGYDKQHGCDGRRAYFEYHEYPLGERIYHHGLGYQDCPSFTSYKQKRAIFDALIKANIPVIYRDKTMVDYDINETNKKICDFINENFIKNIAKKLPSIYVCGGPGSGKTMLASIMAAELVKQDRRVYFTAAPELLGDLRAAYANHDNDRVSELIEHARHVEYLILDDFGVNKINAWTDEVFFSIINERYVNQRPLMITSNLDSAGHLRKYTEAGMSIEGARLISRLGQMIGKNAFVLSGKCRRSVEF